MSQPEQIGRRAGLVARREPANGKWLGGRFVSVCVIYHLQITYI
jgi:hypothetical protein